MRPKKIIAGLGLGVLLATFTPPEAQAADPPPMMAQIPAHPALWTAHGAKGTVYLFGSLHILPPEVNWHTAKIDAAIAGADVYVFEVPMDAGMQETLRAFVRNHAMLPPDEHLRDLLSPKAKEDFDKDVALTRLSPLVVNRMRPWFAALALEVADMVQHGYSPASGVDVQIHALAVKSGKPIRALETPEQQLALLAPPDSRLEVHMFESDLLDLSHQDDEIGPLMDAWAHGNAATLSRLSNASLEKYPDAKKAFFDRRNAAWIEQIAAMLDDEDHVFFITVGAGHLVGHGGVPALLRARGYRVDGP